MTAAEATLAAARPQRVAWIDRARGVALVAMVIFHFSFDLSLLGLVDWPVGSHPAWRGFAMAIAASFIALAGVSLQVAARGGLRWRPYLRRLAILALAAAGVTVATHFAMGVAVRFGILHAIATFSVLALPFLRAPGWLVAAAAALVFAGQWLFVSELFAPAVFYPLGLSPTTPPSFDYEPVFPWFAAMLAGLLIGRAAPVPRGPAAGDWLAVAGRHSLVIYLAHQPILLGALIALVRLGAV